MVLVSHVSSWAHIHTHTYRQGVSWAIRIRKTAPLTFKRNWTVHTNEANQQISSEFDIGVAFVYVWPKWKEQRWHQKPIPQHTLDSNGELHELSIPSIGVHELYVHALLYMCMFGCVSVYIFTSERHTDKMRRNGENISCWMRMRQIRKKKELYKIIQN